MRIRCCCWRVRPCTKQRCINSSAMNNHKPIFLSAKFMWGYRIDSFRRSCKKKTTGTYFAYYISSKGQMRGETGEKVQKCIYFFILHHQTQSRVPGIKYIHRIIESHDDSLTCFSKGVGCIWEEMWGQQCLTPTLLGFTSNANINFVSETRQKKMHLCVSWSWFFTRSSRRHVFCFIFQRGVILPLQQKRVLRGRGGALHTRWWSVAVSI